MSVFFFCLFFFFFFLFLLLLLLLLLSCFIEIPVFNENRVDSETSDLNLQGLPMSLFKFRLNGDLHKPPKYFNAGSRIGQIMHARIRMECSSLNSHLYKKNIVHSPLCSCGGFERAYHFFFQCPNFSEARRGHLPNNLNDYNTNQLLHGLPDASNTENEVLFTQVQDFIVHSKRFR